MTRCSPPMTPPRVRVPRTRRPHRKSSDRSSRDSGGLRLTNLPKGSTVMVDSKPLLEPETRLPVGAHEVAISAPRYTFFTDTVDIAAGQMLVFAPELVPIGTAPNAKPDTPAAALDCSAPSPANRYGRACYDKPPLPGRAVQGPAHRRHQRHAVSRGTAGQGFRRWPHRQRPDQHAVQQCGLQ